MTDPSPTPDPAPTPLSQTGEIHYTRFDIGQRIAHIVMLSSFTVLGVTGLVQKFAESPVSLFIMRIFGGIEPTRVIHRTAAILLMVVSIYHVLDVLYRVIVLRSPLSMLPVVSDFTHLLQDIAYYTGFRKHKAHYGRYSYVEKAEYLALVWGTVLMAITGFMMWNPLATARWLPGEAIPAAKAAHGGEAILAVLAIIIWHMYHVHIKAFNKSMFTGRLSETEMKHEHPAELAAIQQGKGWQRPPADVVRRRQRVFFPIAGVLAVFLGLGVVGFTTIEKTAIDTVPRGESAQVFVPLTPTPRPTLAPTATVLLEAGGSVNSWQGTFETLFRNRCSTCHSTTRVSGLSLATYQDALKGGKSGAGIIPGDAANSMVVKIQSAGGHPGQLTPDELQKVIDWINAGAPEK